MTFHAKFESTPDSFRASFGEIQMLSNEGAEAEYERGYSDGMAAATGTVDAIIARTITEIESNVSKVEDHVFYTCRLLESAIFPNATSCGDNSFRDCNRLTTAVFPNASDLQGGSFRGCSSLEYIDLPSVVKMYASVFQGCSKLKTVILRANAVCSISNSNAFTDTPIAGGTGFVYVPDDLVAAYQANSAWKTYAAQIKPISEFPKQ